MLALFGFLTIVGQFFAADAAEFKPLFNGKDLTGWDTFLGRANPGGTNYGLNLDPEKVFTVKQVDGRPVIHISGKYWGGIIATQEFANFMSYFKLLKYSTRLRNSCRERVCPIPSGIGESPFCRA